MTTGPSFDSNPAFSPGGKRVVFERDPGVGKSHIFAVNVDGSDLQQLTNGSFNDSEPVYAPNGKRIVFVGNVVAAILFGGFAFAIYVPSGYYLEMWLWRRRQRKREASR